MRAASVNLTTSQPVLELLDRLEGVKTTRGGWVARCPAHDDRSPSLSVGEGLNGRALLHCHAGCSTESVLNAIGLTFKDLYEGA